MCFHIRWKRGLAALFERLRSLQRERARYHCCLPPHADAARRTPARATMSYLLPHLRTGWAVDQAILNEEDRVVVVRFGHDYDPVCMQMDEALSKIADKVKNFCVVYLVDITEVPDFNTMYELYLSLIHI